MEIQVLKDIKVFKVLMEVLVVLVPKDIMVIKDIKESKVRKVFRGQ